MPKIVFANWKMNPGTLIEAEKLCAAILDSVKNIDSKLNLVIAPPFVYLASLLNLLKTKSLQLKAALGAQNVFWEQKGAFTGEISAKQLQSLGVEYVLIGHSERRHLGETDEFVNKKIIAALKAGLKIVLCVGEWERNFNDDALIEAKDFVKKQLELDLEGIRNLELGIRDNLFVTYEPVWAISTNSSGKSDTPESAKEMICFIKQILNSLFLIHNSKVLYGGSVNAENVESFLKLEEIDGVLVGNASLKPDEFRVIIKAGSRYA